MVIADRPSERATTPAPLTSVFGFAQRVLDALATSVAVLDEAGVIVAVNASWRLFADDNGLEWSD